MISNFTDSRGAKDEMFFTTWVLFLKVLPSRLLVMVILSSTKYSLRSGNAVTEMRQDTQRFDDERGCQQDKKCENQEVKPKVNEPAMSVNILHCTGKLWVHKYSK